VLAAEMAAPLAAKGLTKGRSRSLDHPSMRYLLCALVFQTHGTWKITFCCAAIPTVAAVRGSVHIHGFHSAERARRS